MKLSEIRQVIDDAIAKHGDLEVLERHVFGDPTPIADAPIITAVFGTGPDARIVWDKVTIAFQRTPKE